MATSPPFAGSPPGSSISLPKKRASLTPSSSSANKRRKQSAAGPSHLRQTSFPPENIPSQGSRSPSVDSNIVGTPSVMSGVSGFKKRRKNAKGGADDGSVTGSGIASGKGRSVNGAAVGSALNDPGQDEDGEEDDEQGENGALVEGGKMDEAAKQQHKKNMEILFEAFTPDQQERYATFRRVRLKKENIRRLVNHTVSQSVPASIITAVSAYTKSFIGDIVDRAIDVQIEWQACEERKEQIKSGEVISKAVSIKERTKPEDRGPLTPDHIREALRRYKKDREGSSTGFLGLSLQANGRENVAAKTGGRRLFR